MAAVLASLVVTLVAVNNAAAFVPTAVARADLRANLPQRTILSSSSSSTGNTSNTSNANRRSGDRTPTWRYQVDDLVKAAGPWGSLVETEIIATDLLKRLPEIARDVSSATRRNELLSAIVLGEGTEARFTVDGLKAVNRQLRRDILPQALEAAPRIAQAVPRPGTRTKGSSTIGPSAASSTSSANRRKGPMEGVAEALYSIKNTAKGLSPGRVRQGLQTVAAETENIFSRTPSGLYSPEYSLEDAQEEYEVRRYVSYAVCSATMAADDTALPKSETLNGDSGVTAGSGEGFNTLAGYLFGNNTQEVAMDMTTPVNIDVDASGRTMSFVMPKDIPAGEAPIPRDPRVNVKDVAEGELLAVREFAGFATDGEVARQLDTLLFAISVPSCTWSAEDPSGKSYRLMQYNPPYTLPWQRTNAVAIRVSETPAGDAAKESSEEPTEKATGNAELREEVSSTISQSNGSS